MKTITLILFILSSSLFAYSQNIKQARAIGIFDKNGNGENIQRVRKTKNDYNGTCYVKIFVEGTIFNKKPKVSLGKTIGHFQNTKSIYNNKKIKIGEVFTYKFYNVTSGYIDIKIENRFYDRKVFVK